MTFILDGENPRADESVCLTASAIQTVERLTLGEEPEASSTSGKKEVSGLPRSK